MMRNNKYFSKRASLVKVFSFNTYLCRYFTRKSQVQVIVITWSSLVEGGEGSYLPNCQTNLAIALYTLSLLF